MDTACDRPPGPSISPDRLASMSMARSPRASARRRLRVLSCLAEAIRVGIPIAPIDTRDEMLHNSPVAFEREQNIVGKRRAGRSAPTTVNSSVRTREYLTTAEIERLMAAARKSSRYGHRDATMILIGYRHGLRASELCDLQWSQVELAAGRLHVRRAKNGSPSVHPTQGDEIRALRRLQREQGPSSHVFMTERDGP